MKRAFRRGVQHYVQQSLPAIACRLMIKWFIDSELCGIEKIEDKPCNRGIFKTPLQGLSSYLSRKRHKKIFPLSSFKNVMLLLFSVETARTNIVKQSIYRPFVKVCPRIFYMNCSKYFSLNPASGNLNTLGLPFLVV